ncbi:MAG: DegT/DnrJ/EryC1/StrS family aminotransferase [Gemmatimonadota bacterium]|nr:DegT/DnrJ/EryC1/StrS family aminotransferase [Gemmatimonadota bacterium]
MGATVPPKVPQTRPCIPEEDVAALLEDFAAILRSGRLTMGPYLQRFEQEFAACVGAEHAVGMSSGTAPLEVALRYWGVAGGEVVVPTNTFIASSNAALLAGGRPVLCDIDPQTLSSSLPQIEAQVGEKTRAVVAVHIAGLVAPDIEDIRSFCRTRGLLLLEDAAHAHGASADGKPAGSLGDAAAFSFFPTKPLTTGEGGMLSTNDCGLADFARSFRTHGVSAQGRSLERLGNNYRLPELSAALGLRQLARLAEHAAARNRLATRYRHALTRLGCGEVLLPEFADRVHAYYKFPVRLPAGKKREWVVAELRERWGIEAGSVYWPPCHLTPFYQQELGYALGDFPVAEEVLAQVVSLPMFPDLSDEAVEMVCCGLAEVLAAAEGDCRDGK